LSLSIELRAGRSIIIEFHIKVVSIIGLDPGRSTFSREKKPMSRRHIITGRLGLGLLHYDYYHHLPIILRTTMEVVGKTVGPTKN